MEDSPLPLETWFAAIYLIANAKNGISSCEVARALAVTQKTAWFLLHRIRHIMTRGSVEKLSGTVECDETFIAGLEKNKHADKKQRKGRGGVGKEIVMGILERGDDQSHSSVRTKVIPDTTHSPPICSSIATSFFALTPRFFAMISRFSPSGRIPPKNPLHSRREKGWDRNGSECDSYMAPELFIHASAY